MTHPSQSPHASPRALRVAHAHASREPRVSPSVLIVEDHEDTRFILKTLIEMSGYRVLEAGDGFEALEIAERERPDIVVMDGSLPFLDGLSTTRRLREHTSGRDLPVVILSGHTTPEYQADALAAGCDGYLAKPIDFDQLQAILQRLLRDRATQ
ncbi:MAG TPA: response regulator [Pyrinomonadaceae bacterium]|jgi:two-component system cell cycle response regulator DivK|nr:response regulator [Pyrinomonadaceae bacterium]